MSDELAELPPHLAQHKRMAELEGENRDLRRQLQQVQLERDAATRKYVEIEQCLGGVGGPGGESLLARVRALVAGRGIAEVEATRVAEMARAEEQRCARWRELVAQVAPLVRALDEETGRASMELVAHCADHLLREEEARFPVARG